MNMPLSDLASFIFYTYKDFYLAAEETNGLHMKLQYWDFFFFFASTTVDSNTSLVSNAQLIAVLRLKGHIMEEAKGTYSVSFWLCHQEEQGDRLLEGRGPSALYPCLQPCRYWFTMFKPVLTLFTP